MLLLSTATTKVLLNGQPGDMIEHRCGLRQGDPLSPMLFILVMDVLNRLFAKASADGLLQPIGHPTIRYQCSMYADDVILFASPTISEAQAIARILDIFGNSSGLRTNIAKCSITPIFCADEVLTEIQAVLPCQVSQFPITYLGVPMSTSAIPRACFRPLIDKVAAKLSNWKGPLMPKIRRLVLTKDVLSTIPTYTIMASQLPVWAIDEIDTIRRRSSGSAMMLQHGGNVWWLGTQFACRRCRGGLRVPDLRLAGVALRTRWLWLQRTDPERAWSALPIHVEPEVRQLFDASITVQLGS